MNVAKKMSKHKIIAIHLPQFHPIPENDMWWGKGFTEWTNVAKALPLFKGHYQPHVPSDLGFYDLRMQEAREAQAELAKEYGIHGFCYYHYWFSGKKLLESPTESILASQKPDFPFCICWANETWSRTWNGNEQNILIKQEYSVQDHVAHFNYLLPFFQDPRYIRVNGKPLFVFYNSKNIPDFEKAVKQWRDMALQAGLGDLYLCQMQSKALDKDFRKLGLDAGIDFMPDWANMPSAKKPNFVVRVLNKLKVIQHNEASNKVYSYADAVEHYSKNAYEKGIFPCIFPSWDNSARKQKKATIFVQSTPALFGKWLRNIQKNYKPTSEEENYIFINAWNEWAEGNHLEPDLKWGRKYLEEIKKLQSSL